MLILAREVEQRIVIRDTRTGKCIKIMVTELLPPKVRLGFEADPAAYQIDREEIAIAKAAAPHGQPVGAGPRSLSSPRSPVPGGPP